MSFRFLPLVSFFLLAFSTMPKPTRVVFFGDSITEAGVHPGGYIAQLRDSLAARNRATDYELIGAGISGNKVYDLYLRLESDVLDKNPDVVVIWVGVNDVWHKRSFGTGTDADKFERFYTALIQKMKTRGIRLVLCTPNIMAELNERFPTRGIRLVLCTPACIGEKSDCTNTLDGELNQYSGIIRRLAQEHGCDLIDLRAAFMDYNAKNNPANRDAGILTTDGVHLNEKGNALVARLMLEKL